MIFKKSMSFLVMIRVTPLIIVTGILVKCLQSIEQFKHDSLYKIQFKKSLFHLIITRKFMIILLFICFDNGRKLIIYDVFCCLNVNQILILII